MNGTASDLDQARPIRGGSAALYWCSLLAAAISPATPIDLSRQFDFPYIPNIFYFFGLADAMHHKYVYNDWLPFL
jgi:hypothetical protein